MNACMYLAIKENSSVISEIIRSKVSHEDLKSFFENNMMVYFQQLVKGKLFILFILNALFFIKIILI